MRTDHFRDKRIEAAHHFASRFVIVAQCARNQRICVTITHVVAEAVSTLLAMTGRLGLRLQISLSEGDKDSCNRQRRSTVTFYESWNHSK